MKTTALILTLASSAYAWIYPNCEHDDCYRNLVDPLHIGKAPAFCISWMSGTTTSTGAIPTQYRNCLGVALLSACSYITYTATRTDCTTETEASPPPLVTTSFKPETATFIPPSTSTTSSETNECTIEIETSTPPAKTCTISLSTTVVPVILASQVESSNVGTRPSTWTTATWTTLTILTITKSHAQFTKCSAESTVFRTYTIPHLTLVYPATTSSFPVFY